MAITPAGIVGTIALAVVVVAFVRLGFWQLSRLSERREMNASVAARMHAAPVLDPAQLGDTAGLYYRRAVLRGTFDNARSIVLPGRSHRGVPGVYLLTPLRPAAAAGAVLVNRGWVASPDAASVDLERLHLPDSGAVNGLILPFPGESESLGPREPAHESTSFRRVWFAIDERALRAQFPYPLLPVTIQELPDSSASPQRALPSRATPTRLAPPPLDEGSHLGYALQWFSFALIGIIGWLALMTRSRAPRAPLPLLLLLFAPATARAQLRPLDPLEWRMFDTTALASAAAGLGVLWEQPATLAGANGRLLEAGNYAASVRSGRIAIALSGTAVWHFQETRRTHPPATGVSPAADGTRLDAGVATITTALRITPADREADAVLRFGASIPTTSDESGLDRDRTDFFATLALRYRRADASLWMENGVGINGTTYAEYPQSDVWTYAFGATYDAGRFRPTLALVGRQDGHSWIVRGNEDQREIRASVEIGHARWLSVQYIRGVSEFSPRHGMRLSAGALLSAHR